MPYLSIQTNTTMSGDEQTSLLNKASPLVAESLDKPERYVMVSIEPTKPMRFAGSNEPCAYLELKSIGLPESKTGNLSAALSELINAEAGINKDRVYIEFVDAARAFWGWNGGTF